MFLKISSPDQHIFSGEVTQVTLPTEIWEITVLPWHQPLSTVLKAWLVVVSLAEWEEVSEEYTVKDGKVLFSVSKWLVLIDGQRVIVTTSAATSNPEQSQEVLEQMKQNMEAQLEKIKVEGSVEDLEKAMINLQKITADLRLVKLKHVTH